MSYTINFAVTFRNQPALTLNAALYDAANPTPNQIGSTITTGFSNIGEGSYSFWATLPDDHVGSFVIWDADQPTRRYAFSVNPQEAEYSDVKTSTRVSTEDGRLDYLDISIGSRLADADYIAPDNADIAAIKAKTDNLPAAPASTTNITAGTIGSVTNPVTVGTNNDKTGYGLSSAAIQAIWDALTSALTTVGSIGKLLVTNIDAAISSRLPTSSYTAPTTPPTVAAIRTEMDTNSTKLDATVSSRSSQASVDALHNLSTGDIDARLVAYDGTTQTDLNAAQTAISNAIAALNNLSSAQAQAATAAALTAYGAATGTNVTATQTAITNAIAALHNLSETQAAAAIMAYVIQAGKTFQNAMLDMWSSTTGDGQGNDPDNPTTESYKSPDGTTRLTYAITPTTRTLQ